MEHTRNDVIPISFNKYVFRYHIEVNEREREGRGSKAEQISGSSEHASAEKIY